ncbi:helix-turn-helix domain-containing protein [Secundilactobacillus kimchicus]|uniref:Insertion element IS150 protein InsJ-like helix-turn-helix domain-containing protein n=1 Tax=Secundilactobacillus kimchicus JCM 15530 TaxID=1302272 RepID=A0A0R1HNY4_9LACO|nr:helix-turn-helix domain-containing protein [Secundilactobacillus kimchicus]KRK48143.1 hypothetical protein FC96_GL001875 [Secundilactobacillus kimchicus JCM 15530]
MKAIQDLNADMSLSQVMKKYGINGTATVYAWRKKFEKLGKSALSDQRSNKTKYDYSFKMNVIR